MKILAFVAVMASTASGFSIDDPEHESFILDSREDVSTVERGTVLSNTSTVDNDMSEWLHQRQRRDTLLNTGRWSDCSYPVTKDTCQKNCVTGLRKVGRTLTSSAMRTFSSASWPSNCWVYTSGNSKYCYWNTRKSSKATRDRCTNQAQCVCHGEKPTTISPTAMPTKYPTEHPCNAGDHVCDKTDNGVCNIVINSKLGYVCACKKRLRKSTDLQVQSRL